MKSSNHRDVEQGGTAWKELRLGIPTSSNFDQIVTITAKGVVARPFDEEIPRKYLARCVAERRLARSLGPDLSRVKEAQHGLRWEPVARRTFAKLHPGITVTRAGVFLDRPKNPRWASSPDGLTKGANLKGKGGLEIKCPADPINHMYTLLWGPGKKHLPQIQGQMWVCNLDYVHFFSFSPEMPPYHQVVQRDNAFIDILAIAVQNFCKKLDELDAAAAKLGRYGPWEGETEAILSEVNDG